MSVDKGKSFDGDIKEELESPGASTISADAITWTEAEERRVVRKLDIGVLFLLTFGFFCFQLERNNIGNAVSSTLLKDIHIDQNQYNTGQGLLYLGIILLEIPSQMALQRIGAQKWLTFQVFCFGFVATFQLFMKNYSHFLATRVLLGITECGYIPGSLYVISTFYKRGELASRNAWFFIGNVINSGIGGLMAAGILRLNHPLKPWQFLFLIEGSIAIFCGLVFLFFLPGSPQRPFSVVSRRLTLFTEREREIIRARVVADDRAKAAVHHHLSQTEIFAALGNWRNYPHLVIAIGSIGTTGALNQYLPLLIKNFGFGTIRANAMSAVGGWISVILVVSAGLLSDKTKIRGPTLIVAMACYLIMWIAFQSKSGTKDKWAKYATLMLTYGCSFWWHPLNATWISLNQKNPQQRAVAMAMFIMASNCGALVGSQLLRKADAPKYPIGFRVACSLAGFSLLVAILQHLQYRWSNKRRLREDKEAMYVE